MSNIKRELWNPLYVHKQSQVTVGSVPIWWFTFSFHTRLGCGGKKNDVKIVFVTEMAS